MVFGKWWRGLDGEDDMTDEDWKQRHTQQGLAEFAGRSWREANPDEDGVNTAGCYNGDYTDEYHEEQNHKLNEDEYFEAEQEEQTRNLWNFWQGR